MPSTAASSSASSRNSGCSAKGRLGMARCSSPSSRPINSRPSTPPARDSSVASARNNPSTCRGLAPIARNRPISAVRSPTVVVMMVRMPTAPTNSEMPPNAPMARLRVPRTRLKLRSMSSWVVRLKSSAPCRSPSTSRICRLNAREVVPAPNTTWALTTPVRLNRLSAQSTGM
ncbi:hypothetical protein D3C81_1597360 [compost metagenome]